MSAESSVPFASEASCRSVGCQLEFLTERNILKPSQVAIIAMKNHVSAPGSILCGRSTIIPTMKVHTHNAPPVDAIAQNQSSIVLPRERLIRAASFENRE